MKLAEVLGACVTSCSSLDLVINTPALKFNASYDRLCEQSDLVSITASKGQASRAFNPVLRWIGTH